MNYVFSDELNALKAVAISVGADVWNPEGGLSTESKDADILEVILDIAHGSPYRLPTQLEDLSEYHKAIILSEFWRGVGDGAVR